MSQNLHKAFHTPGSAAVKHLKSQLVVALITKVREMCEQGMLEQDIIKKLNISPRDFPYLMDGDTVEIATVDLVSALANIGFDTVITLVPNDNA
jgi:hypothetical protein